MAETTGTYLIKVIGTENDFDFISGLFTIFEEEIVGDTNVVASEPTKDEMKLQIDVEGINLEYIISTMALLSLVRNKYHLSYSLSLYDGFIDNDYENYTLFESKIADGEISVRSYDYSVDIEYDEVNEDIIEQREIAYEAAKKELFSQEWRNITSDEYDKEYLEENIDDIEDELNDLTEECYGFNEDSDDEYLDEEDE